MDGQTRVKTLPSLVLRTRAVKTLEQQNKLKRMIVEQLHEFTKLHFTYMFKRFLFKVCLKNYHENISKMNLCFGFWPFISE